MDTTQKIEIVTKFYINKYPYYFFFDDFANIEIKGPLS